MSQVLVKFCGITRLEDALCAVEAGADFLGFIFYAKSSRHITPEKAAEIISQLPEEVKKVGVFVNESMFSILRIVDTCGLDVIQLHGDETPEFADKVGPEWIWKAFSLKNESQIPEVCGFPCQAVLLDAGNATQRGGTGETCDWSMARKVAEEKTVVLAGGLSSDNILEAITVVKPIAVDGNSGVEVLPGVKDHDKIKEVMNIINKYKEGNMQ